MISDKVRPHHLERGGYTTEGVSVKTAARRGTNGWR
jgi:hypothetical protein